MIIISTIGKLHEKTVGYSYEDFIRYVTQIGVNNLIITYTSEQNYRENRDKYREIQLLEEDFKIYFPEIDYKNYAALSEKYNAKARNAEDITKKNISDIIETVIDSYLTGYWKILKLLIQKLQIVYLKLKINFLFLSTMIIWRNTGNPCI